MEPITVDNFFVKSIGTFTEVEKLPEGLEFNFKSKSSTYYVNVEKTHLWRISDHWGKKIRECDWFLDGHPVGSSYGWQKKYGKGMKIGMIAFADLKPNIKPKHFHKNKPQKSKPDIQVQPTPTMNPCVFSKGGFCRTQLGGILHSQCGVRENSFAHQVCSRMTKDWIEHQIEKQHRKDKRKQEKMELKPSFMTTEADDYNSRK